jgi:flagellar export protein FliJ
VKRFRFPLERVRRVRNVQEEIARNTWGDAVRAARGARALADGIASEIDAAGEALVARQSRGDWNAAEVLQQFAGIDRLRTALASARRTAAEREREADRLEAEWKERRSGARALEKLRAKQHAAHTTEELRLEHAALAERALERSWPGPASNDDHGSPTTTRDST